MTEEQRHIHNAYNRAYYAQHRDRILQNKRNNREASNAYMRKYRAANYEKLSAYYSDRRRRKSRDTAFGAFLRENGITQTAAAKMLGVSVSTANCWANGITTAKLTSPAPANSETTRTAQIWLSELTENAMPI